MPTANNITFNDAGNVRTILVTGRLDIGGNDSVATKLVDLAEAPGKSVVVDLSTLNFLASIGIRAIIAAAKSVKARGNKMALVVDAGSSVMMSIKATGVDQLVPVFDNTPAAQKAATA